MIDTIFIEQWNAMYLLCQGFGEKVVYLHMKLDMLWVEKYMMIRLDIFLKKLFLPLLLILFKIYQDLDHELIMNSVIGKYANIWSPEAKKSISSLVKIIYIMVKDC